MFRSYAQNLEDVLLHRVLNHVEKGTYVDIGAGHPVRNSVTKGFYELGWRGVNVEPLVERYLELVGDRPGDTNLCAVVLENSGNATFFRAEQGLGEYSTTNPHIRKQLLKKGFEMKAVESVAVTLEDVFALLPDRDIHFLKIDAEGAEHEILRSSDFGSKRPWIVVVEVLAGEGETSDRKSQTNKLMSSYSYQHVFFDGLNCYYLAAEKLDELVQDFAYPVSILDHYIRPTADPDATWLVSQIADLMGCESTEGPEMLERVRVFRDDRFSELDSCRNLIDNLERQVETLHQVSFGRERYLAFLSAQIAAQKAEFAAQLLHAQSEVSALRNSTSWKVTRPLRRVRNFASRLRRLGRR
jgi:FkbM family methyltransferase